MPIASLAGPALLTLAASFLLFCCVFYVGKMRIKHRIDAPATTGHRDLEIAYRIQMNTVENIVLVLPALWIAALWFSALWASVAGAVWLVGRIWYALAYAQDPKKRGGGFLTCMIGYGALGLMGAWGVLQAVLA